MARPRRVSIGGIAYHVLNRGNAKMRIFEKEADYEAFRGLMFEALDRLDIRLCSYCLMPNHWHMVVWPAHDGDLSRFFHWLTLTHTSRWHAHRGTIGGGHLYQGRFKSFPIQADDHFLVVARYVEANALRAGLVKRAESWPWSSLGRRINDNHPIDGLPLASPPVAIPSHWRSLVNESPRKRELDEIRQSVAHGRPFGRESWCERTARALGLQCSLRQRGRPKKGS